MTTPDAKTFDLSAVLSTGVTYPETTETIYTDTQSIYEFNSLDASSEDNEIFEKQEELRKKVLDSALTFHLRGLPRAVVNAIVKNGIASDKGDEHVSESILIRSTVKITDAQGNDAAAFTEDVLREFLKALPGPSFSSLIEAVNRLEFESLRNEDFLTDPSFS